jgi:sugar lactone lactonase YvrE
VSIKVEARYPHRDELGEGPHWDPATNTLLRVDTLLGQVHRLDPGTGEQTTLDLDSPLGFVVPSDGGSVTVGIGHSVQRVDSSGQRREIATVEAGNDDLRFNDDKCDRHGSLFFGSISLSREPAGGLYRLAGDGQLDQIAHGITVSNGMCWDDERSLYYYIDSWQQRIDVFDCDPGTGEVSRRRPLARITPETGLPDGMAIDDEGGVWVVMFFRGAVHRYDVDGRLSEVVPMPVTCPTSVAFGGPGLRTLFITSSRHRLDERERAEQPLAGAVFTCDPGVAGRAVPGYWSVSGYSTVGDAS